MEQFRNRALVTSTKRNSDRKFSAVRQIDFAGQRDVAVLSGLKFPVHFEIVHQVLPTVAETDVTDRSPRETAAACHEQVHVLALGVEQFVIADFRTRPGVAGTKTAEVRRQQGVKPQPAAQRFVQYLEFCLHEQDRPVRIGEHMFHHTISGTWLRIRQAIEETIALRVFDRVIEIAFFLVAKGFAVTNEELKVAGVGFIDVRIINLVHDAVTQRKPHAATRVIRGAHAFFRARRPAGLDARRAKRH